MPVTKLKTSSNTDLMKTEEGNDSLDTFIRQAIGKEPFLSFSRAGDSPVQWIQLLHALNQQQDHPGWPLFTPLKAQMQKCDKCSWEFYSSINYRRHLRVHHRLKKPDKESAKNKDLLGTFWDKLSEDEANEFFSFTDVALGEVPGSSIVKSLIALIQKPGFAALPQFCLRAGASLLDIIQARPARFPLTSKELFSILDEASEKTFLCGTDGSMQKYIFDGEAGKIGLETKNLVACTSFLMEQKLVKVWLADKDAEALHWQKLLVEEEEAAQRRQAELLERKRQKKLRQKEQKVKELRRGEEAHLKERIDDMLEAVPLADLSCPLSSSDSDMHGLEALPDHISTLEPLQLPSTDEDIELEIHTGSGNVYSDSGTSHNVEPPKLQKNSSRRIVARWHLSPNSEQNQVQKDFHTNQNFQALKLSMVQKNGTHGDLVSGTSGARKWIRKPKSDYNGAKSRAQKLAVNQRDQSKKNQVLIGSISVLLGNCSQQEGKSFNGAREDFPTENISQMQNNVQDKHNRPDSSHWSTNKPTIKLWRPVSRNGMKAPRLVEHSDRESQADGIPCKDDHIPSDSSQSLSSPNNIHCKTKHSSLGSLEFSCQAAKAFLAERWKEAIAAEHVKLVLSPDSISSEHVEIQNDSLIISSCSSDTSKGSIGNADNQLVDVGNHESSISGAGKVKFRTKPEKGVKLKYIQKQRTTHNKD